MERAVHCPPVAVRFSGWLSCVFDISFSVFRGWTTEGIQAAVGSMSACGACFQSTTKDSSPDKTDMRVMFCSPSTDNNQSRLLAKCLIMIYLLLIKPP